MLHMILREMHTLSLRINMGGINESKPLKKHILSLYDLSGIWSQPYAENDYIVHRLDLAIGTDVRLAKLPTVKIHGILAAPPCTVFAASGATWIRSEDEMLAGLSMVDAVFRLVHVCKPKFWVLENPVGSLKRFIGEPTMRFDPCDYGEKYTKKTCLWGDFIEPKKNPKPATMTSLQKHNIGRRGPYTRSQIRAFTPPLFAQAFFEANP